MDIFEYAMQMEMDGKAFYLEIESRVDNKGLKSIFSILADDEQKHYEVLKALRDQQPPMEQTKVLENAKNIFAEMKGKADEFVSTGSHVGMFKKAQGLEEKSRDFYLEKAEEVSDPYQKEIFARLAGEEKRHYFLLDNIIEFVSRPSTWLENAEFFHLDEY